MGKVVEIGITNIKGSQIQSVIEVEAISGKGLLNDRKFRESNHKECQVTLIEIENITSFNDKTNTNIPAINFRRNIITENIRLNELVGKEFYVGPIRLKAHDLCRPCKYLENKLKLNNFTKEFSIKAGIRCEILSSGKINVGDIIKLKND